MFRTQGSVDAPVVDLPGSGIAQSASTSKGLSTEGTVTYNINAPYGTPPTNKPQTQNQVRCLNGLCTPINENVPTKQVRTGAKGPTGTNVIPTGGLGVYVQPAGGVGGNGDLTHTGPLPAYRSAKGGIT